MVFPLKKTGKMLSSYPNESIKLWRLWIQTRSGRDKCTLLVYSKGGTVRYRYHTSSRQLIVYYVLQCRTLNFTKSIDLSHLNFQDSIIYSYKSFVTLHLLKGQPNEILINFKFQTNSKKISSRGFNFFSNIWRVTPFPNLDKNRLPVVSACRESKMFNLVST